MQFRSLFITTKTKRLIVSTVITISILLVITAINLVSVRGNWENAQTKYSDWVNGNQKHSCEQLFADSQQQFAQLNCKYLPDKDGYFTSCNDPAVEQRRNEINNELEQSGCPIIDVKFAGGLDALLSPSDPGSYLGYFSKNSEMTLSDFLIGFPILVSALFFLLSLVISMILEPHLGWFRLTILLSGLSAIITPITIYQFNGNLSFHLEDVIAMVFFGFIGMASLIIYGRATLKWVYSGFRSQNNSQPTNDQTSPMSVAYATDSNLPTRELLHADRASVNDTQVDHNVCTKCGSINLPDSVFCHKCGTSLANVEIVTSESESEILETETVHNRKSLNGLNFIPGFIGKHWRGDYSLAISYWVVGICTAICISILGEIGHSISGSLNFGTRATGFMILIMFSSIWALALWYVVGVWRSADKHSKRGGSETWATIAKLVILINLIAAASNIYNQSAIITEGARMLIGKDNIPPYKIKVIRDGTELELSGGMPNGTAEAIEHSLNQTPNVRTIHLNSIGGRVSEGYKLYSIIKSRNLTTYTSAECASACTIAFLGGRERYISENGKLGFHSTSIGDDDGAIVVEINNELRQALKSNGVPNDFIDHALSTSHNNIWFPSQQELLKAHVIDSVVDSRYFGISGIGQWVDAYKIEKSLLNVPFYSALAEYDKTNFARVRNILVFGIQNGKSQTEIQNEIHKVLFNELFPRYLTSSPDKQLIDYWRSQIAQMKYLRSKDLQLCADFTYSEYSKSKRDFQNEFPEEMKKGYFEALTEMIKATANHPQVTHINPLMQSDFDASLARVSKKFPYVRKMISDAASFKDDPGMLCNGTIAIYSEILSLPSVSRTGQLLRYIQSS